jgi:hypothetical protein
MIGRGIQVKTVSSIDAESFGFTPSDCLNTGRFDLESVLIPTLDIKGIGHGCHRLLPKILDRLSRTVRERDFGFPCHAGGNSLDQADGSVNVGLRFTNPT